MLMHAGDIRQAPPSRLHGMSDASQMKRLGPH